MGKTGAHRGDDGVVFVVPFTQLEAGQLTLEGPARELLANPSLRAAYLGGP